MMVTLSFQYVPLVFVVFAQAVWSVPILHRNGAETGDSRPIPPGQEHLAQLSDPPPRQSSVYQGELPPIPPGQEPPPNQAHLLRMVRDPPSLASEKHWKALIGPGGQGNSNPGSSGGNGYTHASTSGQPSNIYSPSRSQSSGYGPSSHPIRQQSMAYGTPELGPAPSGHQYPGADQQHPGPHTSYVDPYVRPADPPSTCWPHPAAGTYVDPYVRPAAPLNTDQHPAWRPPRPSTPHPDSSPPPYQEQPPPGHAVRAGDGHFVVYHGPPRP